MKSFFKDFLKRGFVSAWGGPVILAVIYYIVGRIENIETLSVGEVSVGILSITVMAFIAGGITAIYQSEKIPVVSSALIHAAVLYLDYLIMYLMNDWIPKNAEALGIFTVIFAAGFAFIWLIIYLCSRRKTDNLNRLRKEKI
ncbi:MAG: DUF3021 domain-containing protein [Oscillospiraceae bacterium]|nr:DUF3021 domain-containing protein [Oscillospiraceae bacterium]MBQ4642944.1 DUF3021 domain-containing protein [Oscillospiraceae bacterium]